jgi:hypothetical protein
MGGDTFGNDIEVFHTRLCSALSAGHSPTHPRGRQAGDGASSYRL